MTPRPLSTRADDLKTIGTLLLLQSLLPVNLALTSVALVVRGALKTPQKPEPRAKTVLVSGGKMTKALQLARSFHRAGHRVILVEAAKYRFTGHRFSSAVDRFYSVPPPQDPGYAEALLQIVLAEHVDVYVPVCSPSASYHDSEAKAMLSEHCEVLHVDPDRLRTLDDKHWFSATAASIGLSVPDHHRITDPRQVTSFDFTARPGPYILKSIVYDPVRRLDLTPLPRPTPAETEAFVNRLPISEETPWILQEFVTGQEYCTHSTVRDGNVQLHCCCESSAFQLNYAAVDRPAIDGWVRRFASELKLTGQASFDFIESADGTVYAIECNPRTHSAITLFYNHPDVARAYLDDGVAELRPLARSRPTYWLYHELGRLLTRPRALPEVARTILHGKEAIFDWTDPVPFLAAHHLQIPWLLLQNLRHRTGWIRIDFNIGKLVEPGGD